MRENLAKKELTLLRRAVRNLEMLLRVIPGGPLPSVAPSGVGDWTVYPAGAMTDKHKLTQHFHKDTLPEAMLAAGVPEDQCEAFVRALTGD